MLLTAHPGPDQGLGLSCGQRGQQAAWGPARRSGRHTIRRSCGSVPGAGPEEPCLEEGPNIGLHPQPKGEAGTGIQRRLSPAVSQAGFLSTNHDAEGGKGTPFLAVSSLNVKGHHRLHDVSFLVLGNDTATPSLDSGSDDVDIHSASPRFLKIIQQSKKQTTSSGFGEAETVKGHEVGEGATERGRMGSKKPEQGPWLWKELLGAEEAGKRQVLRSRGGRPQ